jgi:hypothetical protein
MIASFLLNDFFGVILSFCDRKTGSFPVWEGQALAAKVLRIMTSDELY